jgi:hypothetical protein
MTEMLAESCLPSALYKLKVEKYKSIILSFVFMGVKLGLSHSGRSIEDF